MEPVSRVWSITGTLIALSAAIDGTRPAGASWQTAQWALYIAAPSCAKTELTAITDKSNIRIVIVSSLIHSREAPNGKHREQQGDAAKDSHIQNN
jgi:hypothetical protein